MTLTSGPILRAAVATITFPRQVAVAKPAGSSRHLILGVVIFLISLAVAAFALLLSRTKRAMIGRAA